MQKSPQPPGAAESTAQSIARSAQKYDEVPYESHPVARMQPERLAATARLLGFEAASPATARTLEIGCAAGGHIVPLAARYPRAQFVGLDISPRQVADGRQRIARLGLTNITLEQLSLTDLSAEHGTFDYIVCHGVYSWVPQEVRESLLRVCGERLTPQGIALISFNVLPGWRMFQVVRDSMLLHTRGIATHEERAAEMRRLFGLLAECPGWNSTYASIWQKQAPTMSRQADAYLAHELLEDDNAPCTFADFNAAARAHGLAYLGETRYAASIPESWGEACGQAIRQLAGDDPLAIEQYTDIVTGRTFRQAMLVHEGRGPSVRAQPSVHLIERLHLVAPRKLSVRPAREEGHWLIAPGNDWTIETADENGAQAVSALAARLPSSSSIADLLPSGATSAERQRMCEIMLQLLGEGVIDASVEPVIIPAAAPSKPKVWPLAASDAAAGLRLTATPRHTPFAISQSTRFVMGLADGTLDRDAIIDALLQHALSGGVTIKESGEVVSDPERLRKLCSAAIDKELALLAEVGLLVD